MSGGEATNPSQKPPPLRQFFSPYTWVRSWIGTKFKLRASARLCCPPGNGTRHFIYVKIYRYVRGTETEVGGKVDGGQNYGALAVKIYMGRGIRRKKGRNMKRFLSLVSGTKGRTSQNDGGASISAVYKILSVMSPLFFQSF